VTLLQQRKIGWGAKTFGGYKWHAANGCHLKGFEHNTSIKKIFKRISASPELKQNFLFLTQTCCPDVTVVEYIQITESVENENISRILEENNKTFRQEGNFFFIWNETRVNFGLLMWILN